MAKMKEFEGLPQDVYYFMTELDENNNKAWFDENRKRYEKNVRGPLKSFVEAMNNAFFHEGLPYIADSKKALFRINRDIRFSKNKEPYKRNLGAFFPYTLDQTLVKPTESVGLYFHFEPDACFIAAGLHCPMPAVLAEIRTKISENLNEFTDILKDKSFVKEFGTKLWGESLKRMPKGFDKDDPAAELIKMKEYTCVVNIDNENCFDKELIDLMIKKARAAEKFLNFLNVRV